MTVPYAVVRGLSDPVEVDAATTLAVAATSDINTYASFSTPITTTIKFNDGDWRCLAFFSAHIDIEVNNSECCVAFDISGSQTIPAGSRPQDRLHVICKSPISATFSLARLITVYVGQSTFELKHSGSVFNIEDISFEIIPVAPLRYR